jgi:hypothetical protein
MEDLLELLGWAVAGLAVFVVINNWKACTTNYQRFDAQGRVVPQIPTASGSIFPECPPPGRCTTRAVFVPPSPLCLLNPFPGGL